MVISAPTPTAQEIAPKTPSQRSPAMERIALARENNIYEGPDPVKTGPPIRKLVDVVGKWGMVEDRGRAVYDKLSEDPPCLDFQWMDHSLWNVLAEPYQESGPSQGGRQVGLRSTRSVGIGECDAYRSALSATGSLWWC